ncbi:MAG: hypothetical protein AAFY06_00405, partial [Pseudomonadota bacterium]
RFKFENNIATNAARPLFEPRQKDTIEMQELKDTFTRNAATLPRDFAAVAALAMIAFMGLSLPSFF